MTSARWPTYQTPAAQPPPPHPAELPVVKVPVQSAGYSVYPAQPAPVPDWRAALASRPAVQKAVADAIATAGARDALSVEASAAQQVSLGRESDRSAPPRVAAASVYAAVSPPQPADHDQRTHERDRRLSPLRNASPGKQRDADAATQEQLRAVRDEARAESETLRRIQALQALEEQRRAEGVDRRLRRLEAAEPRAEQQHSAAQQQPVAAAPAPQQQQAAAPAVAESAVVQELLSAVSELKKRCDAQEARSAQLEKALAEVSGREVAPPPQQQQQQQPQQLQQPQQQQPEPQPAQPPPDAAQEPPQQQVWEAFEERLQACQEALGEVRTAQMGLEESQGELRGQMESAAEALGEFKEECRELHGEHQSLTTRHEALQERCEATHAELCELKESNGAVGIRVVELTGVAEGAAAAAAETDERLQSLRETVESMNGDMLADRESLETQKAALAEAEERLSSRIMAEVDSTREQLISDAAAQVEALRSDFRTDVDSMRERIASVESAQDAIRAESDAVSSRIDDATSGVEQLRTAVEELKQTQLASARELGEGMERLKCEQSGLEQITGERLAKVGETLETHKQEVNELSERLQRHMRELHDTIADMAQKIDDAQSKCAAIDAELQPVKAVAERVPEGIEAVPQRLEEAEAAVKALQAEMEAANVTRSRLDVLRAEFDGFVQRTDGAAAELSAAVSDLSRWKDGSQQQLAELRSAVDATSARLEPLPAQIREIEARAETAHHTATTEAESVRADVSERLSAAEAALRSECEELKGRVAASESQATLQEQAVQRVTRVVEEGRRTDASALSVARTELERRLAEQQTRCDALGAQMDASLTGLSATNTALQRLNDRLNFVDEHLEAMRKDRDTAADPRKRDQAHFPPPLQPQRAPYTGSGSQDMRSLSPPRPREWEEWKQQDADAVRTREFERRIGLRN
eukprot:TRINITY_DN6676_c4_g1_i1.p1 TRINITY_DN6676_c4_g1~~TRINITY_DN6676_c4_g1_i1.p1  ORF type:complete len:935 (+),score=393.36 TRINITY_DN6676_c4_g1_i1:107-2911(+)